MFEYDSVYVRFVTQDVHPESGYHAGLFTAAWSVRHAQSTPEADREALARLLLWFGRNMAVPTKFTRSRSKHAWKKNWRGLSWFRADAERHLKRMRKMSELLEPHGHSVSILETDRPGFVVYEDRWQVVAEPYADTPTQAGYSARREGLA